MKNKNSENKDNEDTNALTFKQAIKILISTKWQHKRGAAMDKPEFKVYHWIDKTKKCYLKRFKAYIKLPNADKPITRLFSTDEGEAKAWRFVFDVIDKFNSGEPVSVLLAGEISFEQFVQEPIYLSLLKQSRKNQLSQKNRIKIVVSYFGKFELKDISVDTIKTYRFNRLHNVSASTVNKEVAALSALLTGATDKGYISQNPARIVGKLEEKKTIERKPIENIFQVFQSAWNDKELRDYCLLLFYTGLRCDDVINLQNENIKEKFDIKYFEVIEGKTNKTVAIPIHRSLIINQVISNGKYVLEYNKERSNAVGFFSNLLKKVLAQNNLPTEVTPYWFRHTFQDSLEAADVEEGTIRHLMGKTLSGSLKHYTHANLQRMKAAIDKLPFYSFQAEELSLRKTEESKLNFAG